MHELRRCPLTNRWTVIAPSRVRRPDVFVFDAAIDDESFDPFLSGNESATPHEILAYRPDGSGANGPGWTTRVVPNKFPALSVDGQLEPRGVGLYDRMNGVGAHEVIIECPDRETRMSRLSAAAVRDTLAAYRDRLADLQHDKRLVHATIFKNSGPLAGATLDHSHSQLIALPVVPDAIARELEQSRLHYEQRGRCLLADIVAQELEDGSRVVVDTPNFVAFCPFASRFPFEFWIVPKAAESHYEAINPKRLDELGGLLKNMLTRLDAALGQPAFNYVLHTAPFNAGKLPSYRWHFEVFPRLSRTAGFEWGTGYNICTVPPEEAAKFLRDVTVEG